MMGDQGVKIILIEASGGSGGYFRQIKINLLEIPPGGGQGGTSDKFN